MDLAHKKQSVKNYQPHQVTFLNSHANSKKNPALNKKSQKKIADSCQFNTPMMQQYMALKKKYHDCLLFFRLGDFYELFLDDAKIGSKILNITLTARSRGQDGKIPMAGVPFHSVDSYLTKLVKHGYKVAICEQTSDPDGKNLVEREVVRVVTPGTILNQNALDDKKNNYLITFILDKKKLGIAAADLSTGEFFADEVNFKSQNSKKNHSTQQKINPPEASSANSSLELLVNEQLNNFAVSEVILIPELYNDPFFLKYFKKNQQLNIYCYHDLQTQDISDEKIVKKYFQIKSLASFKINKKKTTLRAAAVLASYLQATQKQTLVHFQAVKEINNPDYLQLDQSTINNLELFQTIRDRSRKDSLMDLMDNCQTAMGSRLLRKWLQKPLLKIDRINERLDAVEELFSKQELNYQIRKILAEITDYERTLSRIAVNMGNPRDLLALKNDLQQSLILKRMAQQLKSPLIKQLTVSINDKLQLLSKLIDRQISEDTPIDPKTGGVIKKGVNKQLDKLINTLDTNQEWLDRYQEKERQRTNISTLKVKFNKVFGFYIEISKANLEKTPNNYERKQTLVNAERFITPPLKKHEAIYLIAEEASQKLEFQIFLDLVKEVLNTLEIIQQAAQAVAHIDCLSTLAHLALKNDYQRPVLTKNDEIKITNGRHPTLEKLVENQQFVANDTLLNHQDQQLLIITGPNMAGKSVYIRQVALITLMAHLGSFVPADQAEISLVDRIFVRSGAADAITEGLSTFMMEMTETAYILNNATNKSLIVMDEIGRGTSTYDGISIASAIAEYLVTTQEKQAKTLFATHYHELQKLADQFPDKIKNFHMAVKRQNDESIFLHQLTSGAASHSFGVEVAKLAGLPAAVTKKATQILEHIEKNKGQTDISCRSLASQDIRSLRLEEKAKSGKKSPFGDKTPKNQKQADLEKILTELTSINISQITPLEAMKILDKLIKKIY